MKAQKKSAWICENLRPNNKKGEAQCSGS